MIKDLRKKTDLELGDLISKLKIQLLEMRFKMANGQVNEVHKISGIKKTIAMAMTVLGERNIKVSFSTHSIQLIKNNKGKQEINAIKVSSLATDESTNKKSNKKVISNNDESNKVQKAKTIDDKSTNKTKTPNVKKTVSNTNKPTSKTSTNTNLKKSSKKQSIQIRRTAKG